MKIFSPISMKFTALFIPMVLVCAISCGKDPGSTDPVNPHNNPGQGGGGQPSEMTETPHVFVGKEDGYNTYRIPAIVKTTKGTLLAFCEGRKLSGSDTGDIDLIVKRSLDGGKSWSRMIKIWDDGINTCGNPCPVVDPETGRIHMLMTWNYTSDGVNAGDFNKPGATKDTRRVWYTYSDDDGLTWATPLEITSSTKKDNWGWYATGPCHGIILQNGPHKGRMVIPCDHVVMSGSGFSHVIYSDDKGKTWKIGGEVLGGNESCVAEDESGKIIITCRASKGYRILAYSTDGGETFTKGEYNNSLPDPKCQGAVLDAIKDGKAVFLHLNCSNGTARTHLTLKGSEDGGKTWAAGYTIWDGPSAYSDMVMLDDNYVGVLYENGDTRSYERITFAKVALKNAFVK